MPTLQKITPCLWFDTQAEDAAKFYTSIFKNSGIEKISRYGKEGFEIHHRPWSLQLARATITTNSMAAGSDLTVNGSPALLHFTRRQDVVAWAPTRLSDRHHRSVRNVTE